MKKFGLFIIIVCCLITVTQAKEGELKTSPLAVTFGSQPDFRSLSLSPEGNRLAFIQYHPDGYDFVRTLDLTTKQISGMIFAGRKDEFEIAWCRWANQERVLCNLSLVSPFRGNYIQGARLVGVNHDGSKLQMLVPKRFKGEFSQDLGRVIDWLPNDPNHVQIFASGMEGSRVGTLDIYDGRMTSETRNRSHVYGYISDGRGLARLYYMVTPEYRRWYVRTSKDDRDWDILHEVKGNNISDRFSPFGFAENSDELLFFDLHQGRRALFSMDLANNREKRVVFAHDRVDVMGMKTLGKYDRVVAATYIDDRPRHYFFDKDIQKIYELITPLFPDHNVKIMDEDWNRRYYLVAANSDVEPDVFYRYDSKDLKLSRIASISSKLKDRKLAAMKEIAYPARDNVSIPAFLTLPDAGEAKRLPAIILPHGGPSSRDVWGFDTLVQFLVAHGYAVLQSNYRGSEGYGEDWVNDGAFRQWRMAIDDINDGAQYLIDQGIADPDRICAVGWSFGGYAALLSAIEKPSLYQCVVSIAGVTDPRTLGYSKLMFAGGQAAQEFIGADEIGDSGSPLKRAGEIQVPVLLAHAKEDLNVPFKQSKIMYEALKDNNKSVEFIEYEHARHDIKPERYRIDLFTRLAEFLDAHVK
ncbi:MAG: alpha/beta fold hydrolase [Smithellaceae bacterium]